METKEYERKRRDCLLDLFCEDEDCWMTPEVTNTFNYAFDKGYNLGVEEKNDVVSVNAWLTRDKDNTLFLHPCEPYRIKSGYQEDNEPDVWENFSGACMPLDKSLFPEIVWDSEPVEVEIFIKKKRNG